MKELYGMDGGRKGWRLSHTNGGAQTFVHSMGDGYARANATVVAAGANDIAT